MPDFLVYCVVILLVCLLMWCTVYRLYMLSLRRRRPLDELIDDVEHNANLTSPAQKRRDCNKEVHSCVTADDCRSICDTSKGDGNEYVCNGQKFLCESMELHATPNASNNIPAECDSSKGFLNTISVSELFGPNISCVNTLPAYYQDNGELWPHVCHGGEFRPDPDAGYGQYRKCKCPPGHTLSLKSTHPGPRCIPDDALPYLPSFSPVQ